MLLEHGEKDSGRQLRLAIIGCGSAAERLHGPALRGYSGFIPTVMVDHQPLRAELLASFFPGAVVESDYKQLAGRVDAAIVSLPSHLNATVATALLKMGVSVLVEKPAALTIGAAQALAAAEIASKASLTVGFIRRESVGVRMAKAVLDSGLLGTIRGFSIEDGYLFDWSAVNEFRFDKACGGGILLDIGTHVLDTAAYWFGDVRITRYSDDNVGGVETNALIELETDTGVIGTVELSWNRVLRNSARIIGTNGTLEVEWYSNHAMLSLSGGTFRFEGVINSDPCLAGGAESFAAMFLAQLQRWHCLLLTDKLAPRTMAGAADALLNVELITRCGEIRTELDMPWKICRKAVC